PDQIQVTDLAEAPSEIEGLVVILSRGLDAPRATFARPWLRHQRYGLPQLRVRAHELNPMLVPRMGAGIPEHGEVDDLARYFTARDGPGPMVRIVRKNTQILHQPLGPRTRVDLAVQLVDVALRQRHPSSAYVEYHGWQPILRSKVGLPIPGIGHRPTGRQDP